MSTVQSTTNPITFANLWMYFTLAGVPSPGTIPRNGIKGFKRQTGWDEQKGKGLVGATLVRKSQPPCKGSITLQLFQGPVSIGATGTDDFANWDTFVANVLSIPAAKQEAEGLAIYHPQFSSIGLTTVVIAHYTGPQYQGKGMYHVEIEFIEWHQPPPKNATSVVNKTKPDLPDKNTPTQSPRNAALIAANNTLSHGASPGAPR